MLSRCVSRVLLFIASFVARRLGWPLERYFSFNTGWPLLQLGLTGMGIGCGSDSGKAGVKFQIKRLTLLKDAWNEIILQAGLPLHIQTVSIDYASLKLSICGPLALEVRGVYILVCTTHGRYYDASREAEKELEYKRVQLAKIEAEEEGKAAVVTQGWFRKMTVRLLKCIIFKLIRKLQVSVDKVHVRFEDKLSSPEEPLAAGCTLRQLSVKENQENGRLTPMPISTKAATVTELAVYWNVNTEDMIAELPSSEVETRLQATPFTEAVGYSYVVKPCSLSSSLQTARGSHSLVNVTVGAELGSAMLRLSMDQLKSIIGFLGFFKHLQATRHFLQFRPAVPVKGHAREWWRYAFESVVDSIHQSRGTWLWQELANQRELCKQYELHCEEMLIAEQSTSQILNSLQEKMSLLSIMLYRKKVQKGLRLRRLLQGLSDHWAGKTRNTTSQNAALAVESPSLLRISMECHVGELQLLLVEDEEIQNQVLNLDIQQIRVKLLQKSKEVRFGASLQSLTCSGLAKSDYSTPTLIVKWNRNQDWSPTAVSEEELGETPLLKAELVSYLETESKAGLHYEAEVALQPLVFTFDEETALKLAEVVSLFKSSNEDLQSVVKEQLHQIGYKTKKKIKKVITERKLVGLSTDMWLPLVLVPENGNIARSDTCLALNPGYLKVETNEVPEQHLVQYSMQLSGMSVSLVEDGENWYEVLQPGAPPALKHQLLSVGTISLNAAVTLPTDDQELQPSTHVIVALPQISVHPSNSTLEKGLGLVSQQVVTLRELQAVALRKNIRQLKEPTGQSPSPPIVYTHPSPSADRVMEDVGRIRNGGRIGRHHVRTTRLVDDSKDFEDQPLLYVSCKVDKIFVCISESQESHSATTEYLQLSITGVEASAELRKDTMQASLRVGSLGLEDQAIPHKATPVQIISTEQDFISTKVCMTDTSSLYFKTRCNSVKTDVSVNVAPLCLSIHEESLLHLLKFVLCLKVQHSISVMFNVVPAGELPAPYTKQVRKRKEPHQHKRITNARVCVQITKAVLVLCTSQQIMDLKVSDIEAEVMDTTLHLDIKGSVKGISLTDSLQACKDYKEVVASKPVESFLQFKCVLKKALQDESIDEPDTGIRLESMVSVGEITVNLLFKFVRTIQLYALHLVHETVRIWKDMGTQWQTAGQHQIVEAQLLPPARLFKYHISVDIHAVILVLPTQSSTLEQLVLRFHSMHLANKYEVRKQIAAATTASITSSSQHTILEKITLEIDRLSLTRHAPDGTLVNTLAADPEIKACLIRVVAGQHACQARLSARMDIGEIQVQLSDEDLRTVPKIIQSNLSEAEPLGLKFKAPSGIAAVESPSKTEIKDPSTTMDLVDVVVNMDGLKCALSMLKPDMDTLCEIGLSQLYAHVCYCSDSSLKVSGSLQDISLVNSADKGSVITKGSAGQLDAAIMEITMQLEPSKEIEVKAQLRHIHAYIWPAFVAKLLKFINASIPKHEEKPKSDLVSGEIIPDAMADGDAVFEEPSAHSPVKFTAVLIVDDLSLVLLEASNGSPSYGVCVELHPMDTHTQGMKLELSLAQSELQLSDCLCFEVSICHVKGENIKLVQVMNPCCLQVSYLSSSVEDVATLEASQMVIFLTNEAIKSISGPVMECIELLQNPRIKSPEQSQMKLSGNIWEVKNIDRDKELEHFKALREEENVAIPKEKRRLLHPKKKQQATFNLPEVIINYDVLYAGDSTSLLCLTTAVKAGVNSWATEIMIDAQLKADAFVYNYRVAAWEPLLEPLEDPAQECYRPWTMVAKVRQVRNVKRSAPTQGPVSISSSADTYEGDIPPSPSFLPTSRGSATPSQLAEDIYLTTIPEDAESSGQHGEGGGKTLVVVLSSDDRLELTVSPGAIQTLQDVVNSLGEDDAKVKEHLANCSYENRLPMRIENKTGLNVMVFPGPTFKLGLSKPHYSTPIILSRPQEDYPEGISKSSSTETSSILGNPTPDTKMIPEGAGTSCNLAYCSLEELSYPQEYASEDSSSSDTDSESDDEEDEEDEEEEEMKGVEEDKDLTDDSTKKISHRQLQKALKSASRKVPQTKQKLKCKTIPGSVHGKAPLWKKIKWKPRYLSKNHMTCFQAEGGKKSRKISISLPAITPISLHLPPGRHGGKMVKGVCKVKIVEGVRTLTIRSGLQVKNTLPYVVSLHTFVDGTRQALSSLEQGKSYDVPVPLMASGCPLQVDLLDAGRPSIDVLDWKALIRDKTPVVLESVSHGKHIFFQAIIESHPVVNRREHVPRPAHVILLQPAFSLQNLLPLPSEVTIKGSLVEDVAIAPGETKHFYQIDPRSEPTVVFQLPEYHKLRWAGEASLKYGSHGISKIKMKGFDFGQELTKMHLSIYSDAKHPSLFQLYCPYYTVNKTGLPLEFEHQPSRLHKNIKSSDSGYPNSVTLIYYKPHVEEKNRKLKLRLPEGHWSKAIALSTTGKAGNVSSISEEGVAHEFGVQNHLSGSTLTHCLYVLPKFNVINNTQVAITCQAYNTDRRQLDVQHSVTVGPTELKPFWNGGNQHAVLVLEDTQFPTKPFSLEQFSTTVLATSQQAELSGITVQVQPDSTQCCVLISIFPYMEGTAPIRVDNFCHNLKIDFSQRNSGQRHTLSPGHSKLYTWDKPSGKKQLLWKVVGEGDGKWTPLQHRQGKKHGSRMVRVARGEMVTCFWKVGYDGSQLVLRIFDDAHDYLLAAELFCSLEGMGLSLVDSTPFEVAYGCILSSPAVWLMKRPGGQYNVIEPEKSILLEVAWRTSDEDVEINGETYDLTRMQIYSSKGGYLSRVFNPGVWLWASATEQQYALNIKLGRMQVDNQLRDYTLTNRIVLAAKRLLDPQEVIAPFLDAMVIVLKPSKGQNVIEVEKAYAELKAVHLNIELGLIAALVSLTEPFLEKKLISRLGYSKKLVEKPLSDILKVGKAHTARPFTHFKKLQLAPIKVVVTYTTAGEYDLSGVLGLVVDSIIHFASLLTKGSTSFELEAIEITDETFDLQQLLATIVGHYENELLGHIHSIAFGLDIIGNPARLLRSFEVAAKDFISESRKGLDEGELDAGVLGVAGGVKDFLGHVIEGSAESVASTTGAFRSSLLSITDIDYRKMHRRRSQATEGLTANVLLGTKFFAEGIFHGLTDIFLKPIKGAEKEGAKGFLKGLGTGALSILTKPTLGVVDLAHFTLEGIRSAVDDDPERQTVRLARFIHHNKVITPFNTHEAQGLHILWSVLHLGKESYYGHEWLPTEKNHKPRVFLVSSLHLLRLKRDGKQFKVDDWSAKVEYLEDWEVVAEEDEGGPALCIKYGDDTFLEKLGSKLFNYDDHEAEVHKAQTFPLATEAAAKHLSDTITEAWKDSKWHLKALKHH